MYEVKGNQCYESGGEAEDPLAEALRGQLQPCPDFTKTRRISACTWEWYLHAVMGKYQWAQSSSTMQVSGARAYITNHNTDNIFLVVYNTAMSVVQGSNLQYMETWACLGVNERSKL